MNRALSAMLLSAAVLTGWSASAPPAAAVQAPDQCSQGCLERIMNRYLSALTRHDVRGIVLARGAEVRENTDPVQLGAADSWKDIAAIKAQETFTDSRNGNVVARCAVAMTNGRIGSLSVRLQVRHGKVDQVETSFNKGTGPFDAENLLHPDITWEAIVPPARRVSREQMVQLANAYFDAISKHDAATPIFSGRCDRYESGKKMTNNFSNTSNESGAVTCAQSLAHLTGEEVVQRRFPLVDEEHSVVLGYGFIAHRERKSPQATGLAEVFKIVDGKIREIENVETVVAWPPHGGFGS